MSTPKTLRELSTIVHSAHVDLMSHHDYVERLQGVAEVLLQTYDDPDNAPQTLEFQIDQLRWALNKEPVR